MQVLVFTRLFVMPRANALPRKRTNLTSEDEDEDEPPIPPCRAESSRKRSASDRRSSGQKIHSLPSQDDADEEEPFLPPYRAESSRKRAASDGQSLGRIIHIQYQEQSSSRAKQIEQFLE